MVREWASLKLWINFIVYLLSILSSYMKSRDCRTITRTKTREKLSDLSPDRWRIDRAHDLLIQVVQNLWFECVIVFCDRAYFFYHFYQSTHKLCHPCTRQPDYCPHSPQSLSSFRLCTVFRPLLRYPTAASWNNK